MSGTILSRFTDACLSPAPSLEAWCRRLCRTALPVFEQSGTHGAYMAVSTTEREQAYRFTGALAFVGAGAGEEWVAIGLPEFRRAFGASLAPAFRPFRIGRVGQMMGLPTLRKLEAWSRFKPARSYSDSLNIDLTTATGFSLLASLVPNRGASERPRDLRLIRRVILRTLPARLAAVAPEDADAVIAPDGRVLHAPGLGRGGVAMLSAAVRALERERLEARTAGEGERLWDELLAGRWSIVEHEDRDGKRVLLLSRGADRDAVLTPAQAGLLERIARGDSLKRIAIELDLPESTASERVTAVLSKLGFRSRADYLRYARRPND